MYIFDLYNTISIVSIVATRFHEYWVLALVPGSIPIYISFCYTRISIFKSNRKLKVAIESIGKILKAYNELVTVSKFDVKRT